jgi:molybdopterin converting factor small subunit
MNGTVSVRGFGPLEEVVPHGSVELELPATNAAIRTALEARWPALSGAGYSLAVDLTIVGADEIVTDATEIALLPPFAGG